MGQSEKSCSKPKPPAPRIQQHLCSYSYQTHGSQGTYQLFPDSSFLLNSGGSSAGALLCVPAAAYQDRCVVSAAGIATEFELPQQEVGQSQSVRLSPATEIALSPVSPSHSVRRGEQELFSPGYEEQLPTPTGFLQTLIVESE